MQEWVIIDGDKAAHWVKLRAEMYLLAACQKPLPKSQSRRVATRRVTLAQSLNRAHELPEKEAACEECARLAELQA